MKKSLILIVVLLSLNVTSQNNTSYWQQHVDYTMDVDIDVQITGSGVIKNQSINKNTKLKNKQIIVLEAS